jgi:hypothetical protein
MLQQTDSLTPMTTDAILFISALCVNVAKKTKEIKKHKA